MKKLILVLLPLLSSCDQLTPQAKPYEPPIVCMASALVADDEESPRQYYSYSIRSEFDRSKLDTQIKISLNDEVVFDSCTAESIDGLALYPYYDTLSLYFDLRRNDTWRDLYIDEEGKPLENDIVLKVETRARCNQAWREVVPRTLTDLSWYETGGGCTPPGYSGSFSVPLGN